MQGLLALLAVVGAAWASPVPQGVTSAVAPSASTPAGCSPSHDGSFEITVVNISTAAKRDLEQVRSSLNMTGPCPDLCYCSVKLRVS